ncbi:hypothetical protein HOY80DRAFT_513209 [Tuber brumale]|nr:hypothetical protein HOY80DRAFT_513209 [Tuber brumale]
MLVTTIMWGLGGCFMGSLMCTGFLARIHSHVCAPGIKSTSHEHLGARSDSCLASEQYDCPPSTKGSSLEHLDPVPQALRHTQEYNLLYGSQGVCNKYLDTPLVSPMSTEKYECVYVIVSDLFLTLDYVKCYRLHGNDSLDSNGEVTHESCHVRALSYKGVASSTKMYPVYFHAAHAPVTWCLEFVLYWRTRFHVVRLSSLGKVEKFLFIFLSRRSETGCVFAVFFALFP